jgi:hypothetical protein
MYGQSIAETDRQGKMYQNKLCAWKRCLQMVDRVMKRYASWLVLLVLFFIVASGGCSASDLYDESAFLPDGNQFNGTWRAAGHPDIVIDNFTFTDGGWGARTDVTIGGKYLGNLSFGDLDGRGVEYFHWSSTAYPRGTMSVEMGGGYSSCIVAADFELEDGTTIEIDDVVYTK